MNDPFNPEWVPTEDESQPQLSYPPSLPHDVAMCISSEELDALRIKYDYTPTEFDYILRRPDFRREFSEWQQRFISEGNSFKLKLRAMSEEFLPQLHQILHSDTTAPSVKVDAFKYITKVAELEPVKQDEQSKSQGTKLIIQWQDGSGTVAVQT